MQVAWCIETRSGKFFPPCLFMLATKKTPKIHINTALWGEPSVAGGFRAQTVNNA